MANTKKVKHKKLKVKRLLIIILIITIIVFSINYIINLPIKHIKIIGTNIITDNDIIEKCGIKNYPPIYKISSKKLMTDIKDISLVNSVKISKNILGTLTITIDEDKILFFNKSKNLVVTANNKEIPILSKYLGMATLINYVPDKIYQDLINGLIKITPNILSSISEIEYNPSKSKDGNTIDENRFKLLMNDGNTVYVNTLNIEKLNKYIEICSAQISSLGLETKGSFYLDSATTNYSFESYSSVKEPTTEVENEN